MADGNPRHVVRRLNAVLDLEPERLAEGGRTKWQMAVPEQQDGRVTALTRAVIETDPADQVQGQQGFTPETEPRIGDSGGAERAKPCQEGRLTMDDL